MVGFLGAPLLRLSQESVHRNLAEDATPFANLRTEAIRCITRGAGSLYDSILTQ